MSAYVIAHATIKDPAKLKEYGAIAGPSIKTAGGELVSAGAVVETLAGEHAHQRLIIIRFDDAEAARAWYNGETYQAAIPIREQAMDATFILSQDPPA